MPTDYVYPGGTDWTFPAGVSSASYNAWGGGASGSPCNQNGITTGAGGGGGAREVGVISAAPGTVIPVHVGAGGANVPFDSGSTGNPNNGEDTTITINIETIVTAQGGQGTVGGVGVTAGTGGPGGNGQGSGIEGGGGGSGGGAAPGLGNAGDDGASGGSGGPSIDGSGAGGGTANPGESPGGGGGGGTIPQFLGDGSPGGDGLIAFTYDAPAPPSIPSRRAAWLPPQNFQPWLIG